MLLPEKGCTMLKSTTLASPRIRRASSAPCPRTSSRANLLTSGTTSSRAATSSSRAETRLLSSPGSFLQRTTRKWSVRACATPLCESTQPSVLTYLNAPGFAPSPPLADQAACRGRDVDPLDGLLLRADERRHRVRQEDYARKDCRAARGKARGWPVLAEIQADGRGWFPLCLRRSRCIVADSTRSMTTVQGRQELLRVVLLAHHPVQRQLRPQVLGPV